jgi:hypothetical protein
MNCKPFSPPLKISFNLIGRRQQQVVIWKQPLKRNKTMKRIPALKKIGESVFSALQNRTGTVGEIQQQAGFSGRKERSYA